MTSSLMFWRRACASVCVALSLVSVSPLAQASTQAEEAPAERLTVADPYLELHTGPGRGFPVVFVVERHDWVQIERRHTDWFKVHTSTGQVGWVARRQLEKTLTAAGSAKTFRDVALDDYLARKLEFGTALGQFNNESMLKAWLGYRLSDTLSLEASVAQVQGVYSGTDIWHLNLQSEPWSDRRLSPFFGIGVGKFKNLPNDSLVGAQTTNVNLAHATVGLRFHLNERFVLRADYSFYTAFLSDERTREYRALTAGLSFFF